MVYAESPSIVIVDDNPRFLRAAERALSDKNFRDIAVVRDGEGALDTIAKSHPNLVLIDVHLEGQDLDGIALLQKLRTQGYDKLLVILTVDRSPTLLFRAARAGANEFLVKNSRLDLGKEVERILDRHSNDSRPARVPFTTFDQGYLRSFGLTTGEIVILEEYANGYPRYQELADRLGKSERQLRKTFSRICKKLTINNLPQLAHVLTVCTIMRDNSS